MVILIHTSKTMRPVATRTASHLSRPVFLDKATQLAEYLKTLSVSEIEKSMKVSPRLADGTKQLIMGWTPTDMRKRAAIDSFLGDIYSGLQVATLTESDRRYAQEHLRIVSGLYGILRPLDAIAPYRLEMGYRLPDDNYANLQQYWGVSLYASLPKNEMIIDLTAVEYGKTVTKFAEPAQIVTPRFLTVSPKTGKPTFVVVHAKIARGAFAHWMIRARIEQADLLREFSELGYRYDSTLSTPAVPVFVCQHFEGLGLSVRLS